MNMIEVILNLRPGAAEFEFDAMRTGAGAEELARDEGRAAGLKGVHECIDDLARFAIVRIMNGHEPVIDTGDVHGLAAGMAAGVDMAVMSGADVHDTQRAIRGDVRMDGSA